MKIITSGRKVTLKPAFIELIEKRMRKFDRFFEDDAECQVTVTVEKDRQTAEVTVKSRGIIYRAERTAPDMETAFGDAAEQIGKQIVKGKEKLGSRIKRASAAEFDELWKNTAPVSGDYNIVREKHFIVKPMEVEEAVLRMNMLNHSFFVFFNSATGSVCVVYRRDDEDYGLLIPEIE